MIQRKCNIFRTYHFGYEVDEFEPLQQPPTVPSVTPVVPSMVRTQAVPPPPQVIRPTNGIEQNGNGNGFFKNVGRRINKPVREWYV